MSRGRPIKDSQKRALSIPRIPYKGALTPRLRDDEPGEAQRPIGFTTDLVGYVQPTVLTGIKLRPGIVLKD